MRIFNAETGLIVVEIAAHSKWINAIDVAEDAGLVCILGWSWNTKFKIFDSKLSKTSIVQFLAIVGGNMVKIKMLMLTGC